MQIVQGKYSQINIIQGNALPNGDFYKCSEVRICENPPEYIILAKVECEIRQILTVKAYKDGRGVKEHTRYVDSSHPCHYFSPKKTNLITTNIHN